MPNEVYPLKNNFLPKTPLTLNDETDKVRIFFFFRYSTIDNSLMSNIQKLFSERIEIFSAVEFSKVSVLTGIIKISLKVIIKQLQSHIFFLNILEVSINYKKDYPKLPRVFKSSKNLTKY